MYRLLVFDWDGTLGDTRVGAHNALNRMLRKNGRSEVSLAKFDTISHNGGKYMVASAAEIPLSSEETAVLFSQYIDEYLADPGCDLYDGVYETLCELKESGFALALLSNKMENVCKAQLKLTGCDKLFSYVLCDDGTVALKPEPDGLLKVISECHVIPEEVLLVGDSNSDMLSGARARVSTCFVNYGFSILDEALCHPTYRISAFPDLLRIAKN